MPTRAEQLAQRRRDLQLQCALQRQHMSFQTTEIENRLVSADRVLNVLGLVVKNPVLLVGTLATAMILGPWRILRWASKGAMVFGLVQKVRRLVER